MAQNAKNHQPVPSPSVPMTEMLKSIPEFFGIRVNEEPSYEVVENGIGPFS